MENSESDLEFEGADDLHVALLRRSLRTTVDRNELCDDCGRHLLFGERVYEYDSGEQRCELCRAVHQGDASGMHHVHGPSFGRTIKIIDRRSTRQAA